jgi:hypothetical protein
MKPSAVRDARLVQPIATQEFVDNSESEALQINRHHQFRIPIAAIFNIEPA